MAKPLLTYGVGWVTATCVPHGPAPSAAVTWGAGHEESSTPGCSQPDGPLVDAFHVLPVTTVPILASTPAGPALVFVAAIATVLLPARSWTVPVAARFHESATRREELT